jgi:hypothetical protein
MLSDDPQVLKAAIAGCRAQLNELAAVIDRVEARVNGRKESSAQRPTNGNGKRQHRISAEGRARIAAAQRKRWAAHKKEGAMHA